MIAPEKEVDKHDGQALRRGAGLVCNAAGRDKMVRKGWEFGGIYGGRRGDRGINDRCSAPDRRGDSAAN